MHGMMISLNEKFMSGVYNTSCYRKFRKCAPAAGCIHNRTLRNEFVDIAYSAMGEMRAVVLDVMVFSSSRLRELFW
jgi:hypothetical protein